MFLVFKLLHCIHHSLLSVLIKQQTAAPPLTTPAPQGHAGGALRTLDALAGSNLALLDARDCLRFVVDAVDPAYALCLVRPGENTVVGRVFRC